MGNYDICVDTAAFRSIVNSMDRHCSAILHSAESLERSVNNANAGYDDVNYEKILEHAKNVKRSVSQFSAKIGKLKTYLQKLEKRADEYSRSGYRGV